MTEQNKRETELLDKLEELSNDSEVDMYSVATLNAYFEECKDVISGLLEEIQQYRAIGTVEELQALKEKKEQGLLLELPCKVGDTVYVLSNSLRKEKSYGAFSDKKLIFKDEPMPKYVECNVVGSSFKNKGNYIKVRYVGNFEEKIFDYETGYDYRVITDSIDMNFVFSSIGKTVFLTKEEAEQHLDWE